MKAFVHKSGLLVLLIAFSVGQGFGSQILDQLVAVVENVPILQSDWQRGVAFEALQQGRSIDSFSAAERAAVLERMIDQQLLRSQMGDEHIANAEEREVSKQIDTLRGQYPEGSKDETWREFLRRYGFTEASLHEKVAKQLQVMRFVDLRLRPDSRVERSDVMRYYTETFVPEVKGRGVTPEALAKVYPKIAEILRQQKMDELLTAWLQDLRDHSAIERMSLPKAGEAEPKTAAEAGGH